MLTKAHMGGESGNRPREVRRMTRKLARAAWGSSTRNLNVTPAPKISVAWKEVVRCLDTGEQSQWGIIKAESLVQKQQASPNNKTLQRSRRQPASGTLFSTTLPQVGGIVPVGRSAYILWSCCRCLLDTTRKEYNT